MSVEGDELRQLAAVNDQVSVKMREIAGKVDKAIPTPTPGWVEVFRDDFNGAALDAAKWNYEGTLMNVKPNGTQQLDGPNLSRNVSVANGRLVIQAKREAYVHNGITYQWTSGGVQSKDPVFTKGTRITFIHQATPVSGMSPGWWVSSQIDDGEFDVPEMFGNAADIPNSCFRYAAFKTYSPMVYSKFNVIPADGNKHTSVAWWKPDNSVEFSLDGKVVHTVPASYGLPQTAQRIRCTLQCGGVVQWRGAIPATLNFYQMFTDLVLVEKPA